MRLTRYRLYPYRLPVLRPLAVRGSPSAGREGALLMVESTAGALGWGDIAPLPGFSPESLVDAVAVVRERIEPWMGRELTVPDVLNRPPLACGSAAFALDSAVLGCMGAEAGLPLRRVLADNAPDTVGVNALLDGDEEAVSAAARRARAAGYPSVKLKVGRRDSAEDACRVRRVRESIGGDIGLRLDANRAWTLPEASAFLDQVGDVGIEYIEEPLADASGLPGLPVPVALDESLAESGWEMLGAMVAVIKPSVQDGLVGSLRIAHRARAQGMRIVLSSLFESGVGVRTVAALAAAVGDPDTAHGLDTLHWFRADVAAPAPTVNRGRMSIDPDGLLILNPEVLLS